MSSSGTAALSTQQNARVTELLDELLELPEDQRQQALHARASEDAAVQAEVASLLAAARSAKNFLSTPARLPAAEGPSDSEIGQQFGPWRAVRRVGRGGMGDVYEAARTQGDFEQRVALKLLQHEADAELERFQAERQILARLEHAGIARLHDGGITADGRPYMVMEFVEGLPITEYCARTHADLRGRLKLFLQVCEAVSYAHRNLVVHRDLKPSNILVTNDGQVKLLDFGIAKTIGAERARLTQATAGPLTPMWAAPEQLSGGAITTAADVYALGLLLFELLTGLHPWMQSGLPVMQAIRAVLQRPAPLASRTAAGSATAPVNAKSLAGDLDAIIGKALRAEPSHRYATVEALKRDVEHYLRGEPVVAREGARLYTFGRLMRRYRWVTTAIVAIVLSLAGGLGVASWQIQRTAIERDIARRTAAREEAVRYSLVRMFRTAIADRGAQPATAKSVVDSSAQRVLHEYADQPQLAGPLVLALADLYGALEDVEGAGTLLDGFVSSAGPHVDAAVLADARQKLANIELLRGHADRAHSLLDQAAGYWARTPQAYAEERLEGLGIRAKLQRASGDINGAIDTSRQAIAQRIALSGRNHRETAILYNSLAITLASANRLEEALAAYRETSAIYDAIGLGDGLDAQVVLANTGTLELRSGHLRVSETLLKSAIEREREVGGDSAAVAAALGYYGKLLLITNRTAAALATLHQAVDLGSRYTGANSPLSLQNRLFLGEAQLAAGDMAGAGTTLNAAQLAANQQYGPAHQLSLRAQLALAQVSVAAGRTVEARDQLTQAIAGFRHLGVAAESNLAQALEALGALELTEHHASAAVALLQEATALRNRSRVQGWELIEARERLGEALAASGDRATAQSLLQQSVHGFEVELGAEHPQTLRAKSALARL